MCYSERDFTLQNYERLLMLIHADTIFYNEIENQHSFMLWRHDVDFSVHRAAVLAKAEQKYGIKATYFFQLGSFFYNILEQEIKELIFTIKALGHEIGLHFDSTQYAINSKEALEKKLIFEKNILEYLFDVKIKVFSFHNPTPEILELDDFRYAGMINTYAKFFKEGVAYCSDSNGYWRYQRLEDFLLQRNAKSQVLTHPAWWQDNIMSPRDRIQRCIDGRAANTACKYDKGLEYFGRKNIK